MRSEEDRNMGKGTAPDDKQEPQRTGYWTKKRRPKHHNTKHYSQYEKSSEQHVDVSKRYENEDRNKGRGTVPDEQQEPQRTGYWTKKRRPKHHNTKHYSQLDKSSEQVDVSKRYKNEDRDHAAYKRD
ncbi:Hypothetical protein NTJ_12633 [Nesidiocoris tenuis]|uniref:Uncharacterized protein n=1 Tax=Nesidiocoris tenuis TaxID=355587 RepID=A0ABN7B5Z1_9HEMI|nr:Hypothetical protein NTJ_12633 [Nesidiocoris tenuis]